jgi:X-X-X-Leu-X-X-Gly heptad repeat protein
LQEALEDLPDEFAEIAERIREEQIFANWTEEERGLLERLRGGGLHAILALLRVLRGLHGRRGGELAQGLGQARSNVKRLADGQERGAQIAQAICPEKQSARLGQEIVGAGDLLGLRRLRKRHGTPGAVSTTGGPVRFLSPRMI